MAPTAAASDLEALSSRYLAAQLAGDRREAVRLLLDEGYARGTSVTDLLLDVIQPAQHEIGRLWERNAITIADEHVATAISQVAMARLYEVGTHDVASGIRIAVACVPGELHDMGARVVADLLDFAGFDTSFLGANVPVESLLAFARREQPHLIALSATMTFHSAALRTTVDELRAALGEDFPIAAGGHAFAWSPALASELRLVASGRDARELVADVRKLFLA